MGDRLKKKLQQLGLSSAAGPAEVKGKLQFSIYFPRPPYDGLQLKAAKQLSSSHPGVQAYNFTGQLLGVGGATLRKIKHESGTKIEVMDAHGNLNGSHPDPLDPSLHACIVADSQGALQKAAQLIWKELTPLNATLKPITAVNGGSTTLVVERLNEEADSFASPGPSTPVTPVQAVRSMQVAKQMSSVSVQKRTTGGTGAAGAAAAAAARAHTTVAAAAAPPAPQPAPLQAPSSGTAAAAVPVPTPVPVAAAAAAAPVAAAAAAQQRPAAPGAPDVRKLFANLEGFSTPATGSATNSTDAVPVKDAAPEGPASSFAPHSAAAAAAAGAGAASVAMPAMSAAAAARASFLLSHLETPPAVTPVTTGPSLPPARPGAASTSLFGQQPPQPTMHPQQQQQRRQGSVGPLGSETDALGFGLPASLLRDLSLDDEAASSMARSRLSGAGAAVTAGAFGIQLPEGQRQQQQVLAAPAVFGAGSSQQQPQPQLHQGQQQMNGLYGGAGMPVGAPFGSSLLLQQQHLQQQYAGFPAAAAMQPAGVQVQHLGSSMPWMAGVAADAGGMVGPRPQYGAAGSSTWGSSSYQDGHHVVPYARHPATAAAAAYDASRAAAMAPAAALPASYGYVAHMPAHVPAGGAAGGGVQYGGPLQQQQQVVVSAHEQQSDEGEDSLGEILSLLNVAGASMDYGLPAQL